MNPFSRTARRLRSLLLRRRTEDEMREEMQFHLEQRAADIAEDGLDETEAQHAAHRRFGNMASIQEIAREGRGWGWLDRFLKDIRLAAGQLARAPGFTVLAVATLGLGIGANTSMFSVLNGIMLKQLPYADVGQLDRLFRVTAQTKDGHFSPADILDFQRSGEGYADSTMYTIGNASLSEPGEPAEMAVTGRVAPNFFSFLGVTPQLGRGFRPDERTQGSHRVVVLSRRTWQNRYGGSAAVIGQSIRINGEPHEVVGVLPESFNDWRHLGGVDLFVPLAFTPAESAVRHEHSYRILGRRDPSVPSADAAAKVAGFGARLAAEHPEDNAGSSWRIMSLHDTVVGRNGSLTLKMLIGLSGFVLLIACSNLANLLLARTMTRAREFAVRAALGASRMQLLRPLVIESLVLALAGGLLAVVVALWVGDWLAVRSTGDNGERVVFEMDWRVMGWAFGASIATAVVFGVAPALYALRLDLNNALKSGGRGSTGGRGHQRFRKLLTIGQFAFAMTLLAGAGVFIKGLHDLNNRRSGWNSDNLVTGTLLLPSAKYPDDAKVAAFHRLALERLRALPGVASASVSTFAPFFDWPNIQKIHAEGHETPKPGHEPAAAFNAVTPGYFETFGTPLVSGRTFDGRDEAGAARVLVISSTAAQTLFGTRNAVGKRIARVEGETQVWGEVVGVVSDIESAVEERSSAAFQIYEPMPQRPGREVEIAVRTAGVSPGTIAETLRSTIAQLDPDLPVQRLQSADATITRANYQLAVLRDILTSIAVLGLGLASLGIYGVIARTMAQRTGEFAIRLALGAGIEHITRIVLVSGVRLALVGSAIGLAGALGVSRLLSAGFPSLELDSGPAIAGATLVLVGVALLACWLPARRAGKVDAIAALRAD